MPRTTLASTLLAAFMALTLAGCLPSSCSRTETRALMPADSLSRSLAEATPIDTLRALWERRGTDASPFAYPRTVRFDGSGRLHVSDAEANAVYSFDAEGRPYADVYDAAFAFPYLAGTVGDSLAVFNPERQAVDWLYDGRRVGTVALADGDDMPPLQYAAAGRAGLFVKRLGEAYAGHVARFGLDGTPAGQWPLDGPLWRHAGPLALADTLLLSTSGYRPVVDAIRPEGGMDSLVLSGFDSPMLARSRSFLRGDIHQPPLLIASAASAGGYLYVLNLRPGWLRIDVFDDQGVLHRRLVEPAPAFGKNFYPVDLAARALGAGRYGIAVVFVEPEPLLAYYEWRAGEATMP